MPIAAGSLTRPGMVNSAGGANTLFLAMASGEVLAAFNEFNFIARLIMHKDVRGAKSTTFPAFGRLAAGFHTIGNDIFEDGEAGQFNHVNRVVYIDDLLIAATALDEVESLKSFYSVRAPYTEKAGNSLASQYDVYGMIAAVRSARVDEVVNNNQVPADMGALGAGGFVGSLTAGSGSSILTGLFSAKQNMTEKDVPNVNRYCPLRPSDYNPMSQNTNLLNRDYGNEGNGIFFNGEVYVAAGYRLIETNHLPSTNIAVNPTGANNTYTGDFTATITAAIHTEAIGCAWIMPPVVEIAWLPGKQCWAFIGKTSQGMGYVRPECSVELSTAAVQPAL